MKIVWKKRKGYVVSSPWKKFGYNVVEKEMNSKKIITYIGVFFIALFILNIYSSLLWDIKEAAGQLDVDHMIMLHISAMVFCLLFGVLLEWKRLIQQIESNAWKILMQWFIEDMFKTCVDFRDSL